MREISVYNINYDDTVTVYIPGRQTCRRRQNRRCFEPCSSTGPCLLAIPRHWSTNHRWAKPAVTNIH